MIVRVLKALVPEGMKEVIALSIFTPIAAYIGYVSLIKEAPTVTVYTEAVYPKQAYRDGYFFISTDLAFSETCSIKAKRIFTGSDGVDYLVAEDEKDVNAGERMQYMIRVPVTSQVPYGPAWFRSDLEYGCDLWSRYIKSRKTTGRIRAVEILPSLSNNYKATDLVAQCNLPEKEGYTAIKAHYRKRRS